MLAVDREGRQRPVRQMGEAFASEVLVDLERETVWVWMGGHWLAVQIGEASEERVRSALEVLGATRAQVDSILRLLGKVGPGWTAAELARLKFYRWLYLTGRIGR